jgi:2-oxoglutarate dehydrogenase E1 component
MNLPHGMDGQGPEHSSTWIERYLQLMNDGWATLTKDHIMSESYKPMKNCNMQVVCCSDAGNLFHAYRRQVRRDYRKPLINIMNKKLLKYKPSTTTFEFMNRDRFQTILPEEDQAINPKEVKKVVITYGQAYYSALDKRKELDRKVTLLIIYFRTWLSLELNSWLPSTT